MLSILTACNNSPLEPKSLDFDRVTINESSENSEINFYNVILEEITITHTGKFTKINYCYALIESWENGDGSYTLNIPGFNDNVAQGIIQIHTLPISDGEFGWKANLNCVLADNTPYMGKDLKIRLKTYALRIDYPWYPPVLVTDLSPGTTVKTSGTRNLFVGRDIGISG